MEGRYYLAGGVTDFFGFYLLSCSIYFRLGCTTFIWWLIGCNIVLYG